MILKGEVRTTQEANDAFAHYKVAAHRIEAACSGIYERATQRTGSAT